MRILYVEDNSQDADLARIELGRALPAARLEFARTLAEAWTALEQAPLPDVVVIDLNLPDGLGLELVVRVRERAMPLALVMLTGLGDERSAVAALKAGVDDYLPKRGDYLRRLPAMVESAVATFREGLARLGRPLRVLYAEHFASDADLTRRHFERHSPHIRLEVVDTLDEARRALECPGTKHDVLLMDYRLMGMNALEFLREIQLGRSLPVPVVLVTGQGDEAVAVEALRMGVSDYVVKRAGYLHEIPATLENAFHRAQLSRERAALRASDASRRLREEALDSLPLGVILADERRRIVYANPAFTQITGYAASDVIGRSCSVLQGPGTSTEAVAAMREAFATGRTYEGELLNYRQDGTPFWNHLSITPVRDETGNVSNYIAVQLDVTARRRTEAALRASEERFRQLAENIHEVFWMSDPEKRSVLYVSPAYEMIWGRPAADVLTRSEDWLTAIHPDDRGRIERAALRQAAGDYNEVYRIIRPDGTMRWIRDRAYPIRDAEGRVYRIVGTAEDITEHRKLEEQLVQAQKMEAIGTLAGGIAHDFNNILAAINGYTELLQLEIKDSNPQAAAYIRALSQAGRRATSLVRQILTFSRPGRQERRPLDLARVLEEPLALLRATVPATIVFDVAFQTGLPRVLADATQVHQVLMNLGTNAAHAMAGRPGRLGLKLELVDGRPDASRDAGDHRAWPHVRLTVSDTGHGMSPEVIERIFEPFFTTKGPGEGTGLGLSVVHGVMRAHDGSVTVRSTPGEGTCFELHFPAHEPLAEEPPKPVAEAMPLGNGERLLLVDDEEPILHLAQIMLTQLGYRVETSEDSPAVVERVRARPHEVDLVISDVAMPGLSGLDLAERLAEIRPGLPILLMTGYDANTGETGDAGLRRAGVRATLRKPFSAQELAVAIRRVLDEKPAPA